MKDKKAEQIGDEVISLFPLLYGRLLRPRDKDSHLKQSKLKYRIRTLGMLNCSGALPMSELGKRLAVSKPHATSLINRFIKEKLVERVADKNDRRKVNISITSKGRSVLSRGRRLMKEDIKKNLSDLDKKDIELLYVSLTNMKKVMLKINGGKKNE